MDQNHLSERVSDVLALLTGKRTIRCPHPDCGVRIRHRAVSADQAKRLTGLATDHTRH